MGIEEGNTRIEYCVNDRSVLTHNFLIIDKKKIILDQVRSNILLYQGDVLS
jgi:hypothetical protein